MGSAASALDGFREVNTAGTLRLATAAAERGIRRFVFVSTTKVNGEQTPAAPFRETDPPAPVEPYAISKWEAEQGLARISADTRLPVTIIRSPLVYGPGVKANFYSLLRLADRRLPLPLARVTNRRSLVFIGNLVDVLAAALQRHERGVETFLVSDGDAVSTPELIDAIGRALGKPQRLLPFPPTQLAFAATLVGRRAAADRLLGSLEVDASRLRATGWRPPFTMDDGLAQTAAWYRAEAARSGAR
jgi:nucleoside-diphosphate-sugar epimerase